MQKTCLQEVRDGENNIMVDSNGNWMNGAFGTDLLIIGNGFDLAHGLKTDYMDFLNHSLKLDFASVEIIEILKALLPYTLKFRKNMAKIKKHLEMLFSIVDNWIALENNLEVSLSWLIDEDEIDVFTEIFDNFLLPEFEKYIATNINQCEVNPIYRHEVLSKYTDILCFNYSNTYERLYNQEPLFIDSKLCHRQICHVNGKAQANANKSNIVFGTDYFDNDNVKISWFNKNFQRSYKSTDDYYKDLQRLYNPMSISIIGHSLGETDYHILKPLIDKQNTQTTVYYHNDKWHRQLIHRMMAMLGEYSFRQRYIDFKDITEIMVNRQVIDE